MRVWLTTLIFLLALAVPVAFGQSGSSSTTTTTQQSQQPAQSSSSSTSKQTTTTSQSSVPTQVQRTTGIDPLWLAIGAVALITIIAIALLAARGRNHDHVATVREHTTVIKE